MDNVVKELNDISKTLQKMLVIMEKPENPFVRVMTIIGTGVAILGVIEVIDIIKNWF